MSLSPQKVDESFTLLTPTYPPEFSKSVSVLKVNMTASKPSANMLWGGRFTGGLDPLMVSYNESIYFDRAIYAQDIRGSIAYARANAAIGILTEEEFKAIEKGFGQVLSEWKDDKFEIKPGVDEDIHTANERRLGEIIGTQIAGKLHTGRSRNDQVGTGMRLWLRDQLREVEQHLIALLRVTTSRAQSEISALMPGYTHLQRAQPIRWSHWLLSYGTVFTSDLERLREVIGILVLLSNNAMEVLQVRTNKKERQWSRCTDSHVTAHHQ